MRIKKTPEIVDALQRAHRNFERRYQVMMDELHEKTDEGHATVLDGGDLYEMFSSMYLEAVCHILADMVTHHWTPATTIDGEGSI